MRVVKFLKYLSAFGWQPSVLTIDDGKEYEFDRKQASKALLSEIPPNVPIHRTAAGETSLPYLLREQAFGRRSWLTRVMVKIWGGARRWGYCKLLLPDRSIAWLPSALLRGRQIVREEQIDVIFVTCPPYSASLIGACLKLVTGKRLVLDMRDDWLDTPWYHSQPAVVRMLYRAMERWVVGSADKVVLVTPWSKQAFIERYHDQPGDKFVLIANGCDLQDFVVLNSLPRLPLNAKFTVLHAGALNDSAAYRRNPEGLFRAVQNLLRTYPELSDRLSLVFAGGLPESQRQRAEALGLASVVTETGHLPHDEVLRVIRSADLLVAINFENWPTIIPAKIYEYWAAGGAPVLLLSGPGAAADLVNAHQLGVTVDPYDTDGIARAIVNVYRQWEADTPVRVATDGIQAYDRRELTQQLAQVLDMIS